MSTISNERLEELRAMFSPSANKDVYLALGELLALRKEREKAEPEPVEYQYYYHNHGTGTGEWLTVKSKQDFEKMKAEYASNNDFSFRELYTAPTASVVPEGWKLVPIELTKEMRRKIHPFAEALCHGCGRQVVADCVDNVTASWNDMLAVAPEPCK
ncbi:hypothetical protein [Cronobacter dublinensis]|uniref:hypothetical protein n=1 Tax=Cronobacter dublinensis TaxID=413497 RepID=UPI000CFC69B2|nr:hypothetical protein [Cronobacter dublinensis]